MTSLERVSIPGEGFSVPGVILTPQQVEGAAVIVPGYGGNKEELLGLAWRIAVAGIAACAIDLRGHGEHSLALDENVALDVTAAIHYCSRYGKVTTIGHSLGGRLALLSGADYAIGVSPALNTVFSDPTQAMITKLRSYRVREKHPGINFEILRQIPQFARQPERPAAILYGSRDVPEIVNAAAQLKQEGVPVNEIAGAFHSDIFFLEETFAVIGKRLKAWYGGPR